MFADSHVLQPKASLDVPLWPLQIGDVGARHIVGDGPVNVIQGVEAVQDHGGLGPEQQAWSRWYALVRYLNDSFSW